MAVATLIEPERDGELAIGGRQGFVSWLIAQRDRPGLIGKLAAGAAGDRGLPKSSSVEQVRLRLSAHQADPEMFEALDDAELDWLAL
jgi:hypothetical protein